MSTSELGIQILFLKGCGEDSAFRQDPSHSGVDIFSGLGEASSSFLFHFIYQRNKGTSFRCFDVKAFTAFTSKTAKSTYEIGKKNSTLIARQLLWETEFYLKRWKFLTKYQEFKHSSRLFHRIIIPWFLVCSASESLKTWIVHHYVDQY